jgi:hypothetical protein
MNTRRQPKQRLTAFQPKLVVFAEPTEAAMPGMRALDHPAPWQDLESLLPCWAFDHLHLPAQQLAHLVSELGAPVGAIYPQPLQPRQGRPIAQQGMRQQARPVAIRDAGRGDDHVEQEPFCIYQDMPFASDEALASIITVWPPCVLFSVVLTVWLSKTAALGVCSRPS